MSAPKRTAGRLAARRPKPVIGVPTQTRAGSRALVRGAAASGGPHPLDLTALLLELSETLLSAGSLGEALERLAKLTAGALPGVLRCSITLITEGEPLSLSVSGPAAQALDDLQYEIGEGPGLDAARTRTLVITPDLPADTRWPALADCARAQGVRAVAAVPLDVQRSSVGSLTLFTAAPKGIDPELLGLATALVNQAEVLLNELARREVLSQGATVDRAVGVIIAQRGCGVLEAYEVLGDTAQRLGLDRQVVAERLIAAAARVAR